MKQAFFRWVYIFLCALLLLSVAACGKEPAETLPSTEPTIATDPTEPTEATDQTEPTETTAATEPTQATDAAALRYEMVRNALNGYFTMCETTLQEKLTNSRHITDQYQSRISPVLESEPLDISNIVPELQGLCNDRATGVMNYVESCDCRILSWNTYIGEPTNIIALDSGEVSCEVYVRTEFEWYNFDFPTPIQPIESEFGTVHTLTLNSDFQVISDLFDERDISGINTRIDPDDVLITPKIATFSPRGLSIALMLTQPRYGSRPRDEMYFLVDAEAALAGLADGEYDVLILPCASGETPSFGSYEVCPLFDDAIIFVHGNPTPKDASYDLALETIRSIYEDGGEFYWDKAQQEPLVPAFWIDTMAQELSYIFGIESTADEILFGDEFNEFVWSNDGQHDSPLYPVYYSFLNGEAGINGVVISVDGVYPTEVTIADGTYPLGVSFYAVYPADDPDSASLAAELQLMAQKHS
ncbi:MAG: hypothetical protein IJB47_00535 [Oscillospiraceae bacterium]|nr:hypothetical protein [Oscillospiraceae bacterium]